MNPDSVHDNVRPTSNPINVKTIAGETPFDMAVTVSGWGEIHFHDEDGMVFGSCNFEFPE